MHTDLSPYIFRKEEYVRSLRVRSKVRSIAPDLLEQIIKQNWKGLSASDLQTFQGVESDGARILETDHFTYILHQNTLEVYSHEDRSIIIYELKLVNRLVEAEDDNSMS